MSYDLQKFYSAECKDPDKNEIQHQHSVQKENAELIAKKSKQHKTKKTWIAVQWFIIASLVSALLVVFIKYSSKIDDLEEKFESLEMMNAELDEDLDEMTARHAHLSLIFNNFKKNEKIVLELTKTEFDAQLERIQAHNKYFKEKKTSFKLGLTSLSGLHPEHFKTKLLMQKYTYENETEAVKIVQKHHENFKQMAERFDSSKSGYESSLDWTSDNNPQCEKIPKILIVGFPG